MSGGWRVAGEEIRSYRDLLVWQKAMAWTEAAYRLTSRWPSDERFGLISQLRRSSVSVAANIAEGAGRRSTGEFLQFLGIARGSLAEAETLVLLSVRLGYSTERDVNGLLEQADEISRMSAALIATLKKRQK